MPPESNPLGTPQEWLKRARSNLAIAKQPRTDEIYWDDLCFETQQAAEKSLKAVLTNDVREAAILTDYSVEARYPGPF